MIDVTLGRSKIQEVKRSQTVSCILYKVTKVASSVTTHQFILYSVVIGLKSYFPPLDAT